MMVRCAAMSLLIVVAGLGLGCGNVVTPEQWADALEQHVERERTGGVAALALRDDAQRSVAFARLGEPSPEKGGDAVGVLVEVVEVGGEPWLVYILAEVEAGRAESLRPAAVTGRDEGVRVIIGEPDEQAFAAYRAVTPSFGVVAPDTEPLRGWPRLHDRFTATADDRTITITEHHSRAHWRLPLP